MSKAGEMDKRTRKTFVVSKAMIETAPLQSKPVVIKRLPKLDKPAAPSVPDQAMSPKSRATRNLLLDKFPLKTKNGPTRKQVEQEYMTTKKSFN